MNARIRARGLTLVEVLVAACAVSLLVMFVVVANVGARVHTCGGRNIKCGTQVRGIHQALVLFANGNQDRYPLPSVYDKDNRTINTGNADATSKDTTASIISILIYNGFFSTELCVSPAEQNGNIVQMPNYAQSAPSTAADPKQALWDPAFNADFTGKAPGNLSYANALFGGNRAAAWSNTFDATQAVIGNRGPRVASVLYDTSWEPTITLANPASTTLLIHGGRKTWEGNIAYNDNHVNFEFSMAPESSPHQMGKRTLPDCLFFDEAEDDVHTNNFLNIITGNGPAEGDLKTIWD